MSYIWLYEILCSNYTIYATIGTFLAMGITLTLRYFEGRHVEPKSSQSLVEPKRSGSKHQGLAADMGQTCCHFSSTEKKAVAIPTDAPPAEDVLPQKENSSVHVVAANSCPSAERLLSYDGSSTRAIGSTASKTELLGSFGKENEDPDGCKDVVETGSRSVRQQPHVAPSDRPLSKIEMMLAQSLMDDTDEFLDELEEGSMDEEGFPPNHAPREVAVTNDDTRCVDPTVSRGALSEALYGPSVVIDCGGAYLKCGMSGRDRPTCVIPSVYGVLRKSYAVSSGMTKGYYVGEEAVGHSAMLRLDHPFRPGVSRDGRNCTKVLEYVLSSELCVDAVDHPIMIIEVALSPPKSKEKLAEIVFETFQAPAFYLANQGQMALHSQGLLTGCCLNLGYDLSQCIPVVSGTSVLPAVSQLPVGGHQVSNQLSQLIQASQGISFLSSSEEVILDTIKMKKCYVAIDMDQELESYSRACGSRASYYDLPDGNSITIGSEAFCAPEVMFCPGEIGIQEDGVQALLPNSLKCFDASVQTTLANNVLLSGGTSLMKGMRERLAKDMAHVPALRIHQSTDPMLDAWKGGSIVTSMSTFNSQWVSSQEYLEIGPQAVLAKCM